MRFEAARKFDAVEDCGAEANMAKLLAADASWEAANACIQFHGGFGFAAEYNCNLIFTSAIQSANMSTHRVARCVFGAQKLSAPRAHLAKGFVPWMTIRMRSLPLLLKPTSRPAVSAFGKRSTFFALHPEREGDVRPGNFKYNQEARPWRDRKSSLPNSEINVLTCA